jgi:hypothetical protein
VRHSVRLLALCTLLVIGAVPACSGGGSNAPASPVPTPTPAAQNPCLTASIDAPADAGEGPAVNESEGAQVKRRGRGLDGDPRGRVFDSLWQHAASAATRTFFTPPLRAANEDVGDVAVIQDAGDLLTPPNPFDLQGLGLRFTRNGSSYDVSRTDAGFRSTLGSRIRLEDDDSMPFTLPFNFPLYGKGQPRAFVNSDGNLTFEEEDRASSERNVSRVMTGPPRVAPFFADLDPSTGNGRIFVQNGTDAFTVTWCEVRGFDKEQAVTVQASLLPNGDVEFKFAQTIGLDKAVVGLSPGRAGHFSTLDLSTSQAVSGGGAALGERFSSTIDLDLVAVAQKFYQSHPDSYDQLVLWTDVAVTDDAFAFETMVANEIRGIGIDVFDQSRAFGSTGGRLRSIVMMDTIGKYPADPQTRFLGENNAVSLMGQESGHRWLAFLKFRDRNGQVSDELLGRDQAHWSFFMDSDASVMEGNDIEDLGGGSFRTVATVQRYSLLDQYAMGYVTESQVPDFFYVESPANVVPSRSREDAPRTGVTFNGTKRTVLIQDVVAAMGRRDPAAGQGPRVHRQAFVFVLSNGRTVDRAAVGKIDLIRRQWETFFSHAVDRRARVESRLRPPS